MPHCQKCCWGWTGARQPSQAKGCQPLLQGHHYTIQATFLSKALENRAWICFNVAKLRAVGDLRTVSLSRSLGVVVLLPPRIYLSSVIPAIIRPNTNIGVYLRKFSRQQMFASDSSPLQGKAQCSSGSLELYVNLAMLAETLDLSALILVASRPCLRLFTEKCCTSFLSN